MAATMSKRSSMMGGLALVLCVLAQVALSSAGGFSEHGEFDVVVTTPTFPKVSLPPLPSLPSFSLPPLSLPKLPQFSLPPLPSSVTLPGFTVPGFSIPPQKPLEGLHLPPFPQPSVTLPSFPGFSLPSITILPPLPSFRFPGFSLPPQPAKTLATPPINPGGPIIIPGFSFPTVSVPPTSFPFSRRVFPRSRTQVIKN